MKSLGMLILFVMIPFANAVEITEIMPNPDGSDSGREWVEIFSEEELNLTDMRLVEGGDNHLLTLIQGSASGYIVIADNWEKFLTDYPDYEGGLIDSSFSLKNSGEIVEVKEGNLTLASMEYPETDEGMSWCGYSCDPTPGKEHVVPSEETSSSVQCSPASVRVEKVEVEVEKIVEVPVEKREMMFYVESPDEAFVGSNITSVLFAINQLNESVDIQASSYIHNGSSLASTAYLNQWNGGWAGNRQNLTAEEESISMVEFTNRVESSGEYNFRIKLSYNGTERNIDNPIRITNKPTMNRTQHAPEKISEREKDEKTSLSIMLIIKKLFNG